MAPTFAINHLLIRKNSITLVAPIHFSSFFVSKPFLEHLQENPLIPFVIFRIAGGDFAPPVFVGPGAGLDYATNQPFWNLGCATQRNVASMVDNPADLVQPRGETPPSAPRRSVVLEKYRKGEDTTTQYRDNDKAKISDVGK